MYTITDGTVTSDSILCEIVDIYKIFHVKNVISYEYCIPNFNSWAIHTTPSEDSGQIYLIIDTFFDEAFSHWVYESAIYLPLFILLRERYPTIKICLKTKRSYKLLFCKIYNIPEESIVYSLDSTNTCIFPSPISAMNDKHICSEYIEQLTRFYTHFSQISRIVPKTNDIVLMPRQRKENYDGNRREYPMENLIDYISSKEDSIILHTDTITDLQEQIQTVASAKSLIVTDGSACLVNGMFASSAKIHVFGKVTLWQASEYPKLHKVRELSTSLNNNTYVQYDTELEILNIIRQE